MTNPVGRPRVWDRAELSAELFQYVENTQIPIVAEFAYTRGVRREFLYECPELEDALKACIAKKEAALESKALSGDVNCSMAIFSLKQLGWKDTHEQTHKGDKANPVMITAVDSNL